MAKTQLLENVANWTWTSLPVKIKTKNIYTVAQQEHQQSTHFLICNRPASREIFCHCFQTNTNVIRRLVYVSAKSFVRNVHFFLYVSASGRKQQFFLYVSASGRNVYYLYVITLYDSANKNFYFFFRPKVAIYAFRTN